MAQTGTAPAFSPQETEANKRGKEANETGLAAAARRDYPAAESAYRESASIYRKLGPRFEAHLSIALFNLAESLCGEGKWKYGEAVFQESLTLSKRALGERHLETIATMNALGHVKTMLGDRETAQALFRGALDAAREAYPRHIQAAYALAGLATLELRAGDADGALPYAEEALRIATGAEPNDGPDTAMMYQCVGQIHRVAGRVDRAIPLLRKARAIYERAGATSDPRYATLLTDEGLALMDDGKFGAAEADMKRSLTLLASCPACAFEIAVAETNLGLLRFRQKKYAEADGLLRKALEAEQQYGPSDGVEAGETRRALEKVRMAWR